MIRTLVTSTLIWWQGEFSTHKSVFLPCIFIFLSNSCSHLSNNSLVIHALSCISQLTGRRSVLRPRNSCIHFEVPITSGISFSLPVRLQQRPTVTLSVAICPFFDSSTREVSVLSGRALNRIVVSIKLKMSCTW